MFQRAVCYLIYKTRVEDEGLTQEKNKYSQFWYKGTFAFLIVASLGNSEQ